MTVTKPYHQRLLDAAYVKTAVGMLLKRGMSHKEIADGIGRSEATVKNYESFALVEINPNRLTVQAVDNLLLTGTPDLTPRQVREVARAIVPAPSKEVRKKAIEKIEAQRRPAPFWVEKVPAPFVGLVFGIALALVLSWASK